MTQKMWMVRAGRGARYIDDFLEQSFVGLGGTEIGAVDPQVPKQEILKRYRRTRPHQSEASLQSWAAQLKRYLSEISVGDEIVTYDSGRRLYFLGRIEGDVEFVVDHHLGYRRAVGWERKVPRDDLAVATRNSLGAILSLFQVSLEAADDLRMHALPLGEDVAERSVAEVEITDETEKVLLDEVVSKAKEFVEDRIARLDWRQMQQLVAGLLEAMGYRARLSPEGGDRGVDVFASPDGLGLEEPRIFVEVKHRPGTAIAAQEVRAFLGGRQAGDRCLYVSTGGFTKEARYEADRATVPLRLLTLPDLRELLMEHYDKLAAAVAALVPLERLYWPRA